ncbi:hypothetical protein [Saccharopolyspora sp. NPDC002686]|uniref:hypothetical protein n=1 Tax=Saccharopolyspora sp. NPDC002686 TaxID=3154541 RepID=UPI003330E283
MRAAHQNPPADGSPHERLTWHLQKTGEAFVSHEDFLRLLLVLVMSNEAAEAAEAMRTVVEVRSEGRDLMQQMIRSSFAVEGDDVATAIADELAHFGMAGFDGAFVSLQSNDGKPIAELMAQLADAMAALGESRIRSIRAQSD